MKYFSISDLRVISKQEAQQLLDRGFKAVKHIVGPIPMLQKYINDPKYRLNIDEKFAIKLNLKKLSFDEIREQLMDIPVHEILKMRLVSKKWKDVIDEDLFWCRLLKRDHNVSEDKNCFNNYKMRSNKYYKVGEIASKLGGENIEDIIIILEDIDESMYNNIMLYIRDVINTFIDENDVGKYGIENMKWENIFQNLLKDPESDLSFDMGFGNLKSAINDFINVDPKYNHIMSKILGQGKKYEIIEDIIEQDIYNYHRIIDITDELVRIYELKFIQ
jgi:hypothetical protein